ncbi:unnamed protein product [Symbiodinium sp. CCMP2592]|nr:unnamed protein product [Symbiodinium sp. CCMP2592]
MANLQSEPWGFPGVPASEDQQQETCQVYNDLQAAVEVSSGSVSADSPVLYPGSGCSLALSCRDMKVSVWLRDDPGVCGSCAVTASRSLTLSQDFGDFSREAAELIRKDMRAARKEAGLRQARKKEICQQLYEEVKRAAVRKQRRMIICTSITILALLGLVIFGAIAIANKLQPLIFEGESQSHEAAGVAALAVILWCIAMGCVGVLRASADDATAAQLQTSLRAARPELQGYEEDGTLRGIALRDEPDVDSENEDIRYSLFVICYWGMPIAGVICGIMIAARLYEDGHFWGVLIVSIPAIAAACFGGGWMCLYTLRQDDLAWRLCQASLVFFQWPLILLNAVAKCRGGSDSAKAVSALIQPAKEDLNQAVLQTNQRTIVFEGNVLPGHHTVASWPGKYESAWDLLVAGARKDEISAAVVFLPEGSEHFGLHDPIPRTEDLRDLRGECWCVPLYGEAKPWGCRWWSHWIANIEKAVQLGATLEVYFFNGKKGQGKAADFAAAGTEHRRRDSIFRRKADFGKSEGFLRALDDGLDQLSKERGPDGSSPFSREEHRLFLAWLQEEERKFLEHSEGLGNSQKAEVAWLERKGYHYLEKEVSELADSSPKAMG